ncbi:DoxX family protein [Mesorhizobium muleiense]|uniref:Putative oxidoreductase n=1 Tax=Mesorhizobium muleiense TaxID=1004279 RepID=A0A1G8VW66_9HYPH|nr:DoxX family protein [Mesorhizobium muleiense]MCF6098613.1 DoxX family protein [Mesorhizobium muleiense]SDJ69735.1 putative oxidoreductase [Mesorhizobium muleiense]
MPEFMLTPIDLLRILCGIWFIPHFIGKLRNFEKATKTFEAAGLKPGKPFIVLTVALEFVAAVGMVFGIYPRWAAACGVAVLLGAAYAVVRINGPRWRWQLMGPEYPIFWALACIVSAF